MNKVIGKSLVVLGGAALLASCGKEGSSTTGWNYNDTKNGGFEVVPYEEQETGPGLVLIEGGRFVMGRSEQEINYNWDNIPRTVTQSSFYMDESEVANVHYLEYLFWTRKVFDAAVTPQVYWNALPDTLVWLSPGAYNEPYVELYLRHPAYHFYPVVGVNWLQAADYAAWRTDRVNEMIMVREGIFQWDPAQSGSENFNTEAYLNNQYEGQVKEMLYDYKTDGDRKVRMEDGILLPKYRLPTEAEWEYAAAALIGNTIDERITEKRLYPWNGHITRNGDLTYQGTMLGNFKRGKGDNMGLAGRLNDNADITAPIYSYWPNDYGLFCMAGNVSEWVMDVYRPLSGEDMDDFRPFRGNVFKTQERNPDNTLVDKDSLGRIKWTEVNDSNTNLATRRNFKKAGYKDYLETEQEEYVKYNYGIGSMIDNRARVYKGGSWKDRAYWMTVGSRRFLDEEQETSDIGFRCAMHRVGSPTGFGGKK